MLFFLCSTHFEQEHTGKTIKASHHICSKSELTEVDFSQTSCRQVFDSLDWEIES